MKTILSLVLVLVLVLEAKAQKVSALSNVSSLASNALFSVSDFTGGTTNTRSVSAGQMRSAFRDEVSVVDYGATAHVPVNITAGSYITNALVDSSSAIQAAFNAAYNSQGRSNTVFFPHGIYQINTNIYVPPGIHVRGVGILHCGDFGLGVDTLNTNAFSLIWQTNLSRSGLVFSNLNVKGSIMHSIEVCGHTNPLAYGLNGTGNMSDSPSSTMAAGPGLFLGANTVTDWATYASNGTGYSGDIQIYNSTVSGFDLGIRSTANSANFQRLHMVACDVGYETSDLCCGADQTVFDNCSAALRPNGVGYLFHNNGGARGVTFLSPSDYKIGTWMRATDCVVSVSGGNMELDHVNTTASHVIELYGSQPMVTFTGTRILGTTSHTNFIYYGETAYPGPYGSLNGVRIQGLPIYTNFAWNGTMTNYEGGGALLLNVNGFYAGGFEAKNGTTGWGLSRSNNNTGVAFYTFPLAGSSHFAPATMQPIVWGSQAYANPGYSGPSFNQYGKPWVLRGDSTPDWMTIRLLATRQGPLLNHRMMLGDGTTSTSSAPPNTLTLDALNATGTITNNGLIWHSTNTTPTYAYPNGSIATTTGGLLYIRTNGAWSQFSGGGGGDALVANPLSQFAATTSAQLRGVLSDESGTGVFLTANGVGSGLSGIVAAGANLTSTNLASTTTTSPLSIVQGDIAGTRNSFIDLVYPTPHIEVGGNGWFQVDLTQSNSLPLITESWVLVKGDFTVLGDSFFANMTATNWSHLIYSNTMLSLASDGKFTNSAPSSALSALLTDETGSGVAVLATSPTLVTPNLGTIASGNGAALTALSAANITAGGVLPGLNAGSLTNINRDAPTNTFTINTAFPVGQTNQVLTAGAVTGGITGIANGPSSGSRWGELTVFPTGAFVFTNPASIKASDGLTTRTLTNGTFVEISLKVTAGRSTNMAIVHFP